jgi:hypothetical protein
MTERRPAIGDLVEDVGPRQARVGMVMGFEGPYVQLRPVGGGREWDAEPGDLRPVTPAAGLSARLAAANARSRKELP